MTPMREKKSPFSLVYPSYHSRLPPFHCLSHNLLVRYPHESKPSRIFEKSQNSPGLNDDMQVEMMNRHNVGQNDRSNKVSTPTMIATMDRRARDIRTVLFQKKLFHLIELLDYETLTSLLI